MESGGVARMLGGAGLGERAEEKKERGGWWEKKEEREVGRRWELKKEERGV